MDVEWRSVPGFEGYYEVSRDGQVRGVSRVIPLKDNRQRRWKGRPLRPHIRKDGYYDVKLWRGGREHWFSVHILVLITFLSDRQAEGLHCNHKDGNKLNNHIDNLEWVTPRENTRHAIENGLYNPYRENNPFAKLKEHQVQIIYTRLQAGEKYETIAADYDVDPDTIRNINYGKSWRVEGYTYPLFRHGKSYYRKGVA